MTKVELRNVSNYILKNVSLTVDSGEFLVLLGPNGAGKTTLLNVIAGLTEYSGTVMLDGEPADSLPPHKRNIGYVPQNLALFPHLNAYDNVAYGLRVRGVPRRIINKRVREVMEILGIWGLRYKYPMRLSGGEGQKVAIARALVINPTILLLDEPFNNLQVDIRKSLRLEVREIQRKLGITTIFVTHDIEEAEELGNKVAVMKNGMLIGVGSYVDVLPKISSTIYKLNILKGRICERVDSWLTRMICGDLRLLVPYDGKSGDLNVTIAIPPDRILISRVRPDIAINAFKGKIHEVRDKQHYSEVLVNVNNVILTVYVTREKFESLGLDVNSEVYVKIPIRFIKVLS